MLPTSRRRTTDQGLTGKPENEGSLGQPDLETQRNGSYAARQPSGYNNGNGTGNTEENSFLKPKDQRGGLQRFIKRFMGEGKRVPTWKESAIAFVTATPLTILVVFIPIAWVGHFLHWSSGLVFAFSLLAIIPLEKLADVVGESFALYCGKSIGDLVIISLDNVVEATLAFILLHKCLLRLMQSTVVGVVLLHLLLVPGVAFITGGREILHQHLDPHTTELNKSLLTLGVLTLLIPAVYFAGIRNNVATENTAEIVRKQVFAILAGGVGEGDNQNVTAPITDATRSQFLRLSRGLAILLLLGYVSSRIYLHNPPGEGNALSVSPDAPEAIKKAEEETEEEEPKMNQWFCLAAFCVLIPLTAVNAEWLVDSLERLRETTSISEEWFGLILLPFVSYSAEALITVIFFVKSAFAAGSQPPSELAKGKTIDLSIQFTMFWIPLLILVAWWTNKPLSLLFDFFEVGCVLGACFLVNTVTDDAKTNWAEGYVLFSFYLMIATASWFYQGQQDVALLLECESVQAALGAVNETVQAFS